jgi:hypothetical protein
MYYFSFNLVTLEPIRMIRFAEVVIDKMYLLQA